MEFVSFENWKTERRDCRKNGRCSPESKRKSTICKIVGRDQNQIWFGSNGKLNCIKAEMLGRDRSKWLAVHWRAVLALKSSYTSLEALKWGHQKGTNKRAIVENIKCWLVKIWKALELVLTRGMANTSSISRKFELEPVEKSFILYSRLSTGHICRCAYFSCRSYDLWKTGLKNRFLVHGSSVWNVIFCAYIDRDFAVAHEFHSLQPACRSFYLVVLMWCGKHGISTTMVSFWRSNVGHI